MIDLADRSLDLQYFIWQNDPSGILTIRHVLAAADRGVRVRALLDDVQLEGDAALPKSPGAGVWEEELEMVETGDEAADERLRAALEDMRRQGQGEQPDPGPGLGS